MDRTIDVNRAHTVVLGLGLPSLTPTRGNVALQIADVPDVDVAGITLDAGSPELAGPDAGRDGQGWTGQGPQGQ